MTNTDDRAAAVRKGDKRAVAALLSAIEGGPSPELAATLDALFAAPRGHVLGITGPPGVGKSTLIRRLMENWRSRNETVGVLAVDPSSRISGGALLGDRLRMASGSDGGVFIRSMAAGGQLGGLARAAFPAIAVLRAGFDHVVVETVGVGQSETGVADLADTVLLCVQPGSGDVVQFMKAGIMETPDVLTVTKADTGAGRTLAELRAALAMMTAREGWPVPAVPSAAASPGGTDELTAALETHANWLSERGRLGRRRAGQAAAWLRGRLTEAYGQAGIGWLARTRREALEAPDRPFARAAELERCLAEKTGF
ncbi:MAG: ArgK/MeaB family GTPase [Alphaproteobacteria bacterium]